MNTAVFIITLVLLQGICWWVGRRSMRGQSTQNDYYLGGKSVSFFPLMMTFLATQVGGGLVLGSAEESFRFGWWVLFYPIGQILGLAMLGAGIGKRLARFQVSTVAQIFEVFYRSPLLKKAASILSIVSLFMILVAQVLASKLFLQAAGIDAPWLFFSFWGVLIAYTAIGGMKAVIATDVIQAGFFIGVFFIAFLYALGSGQPLMVEASAPCLPVEKFSGWFFMPFFFMFIEQDMGQRCFAAKSSSILSKATLGAAFAAFLVCVIPVYFGALAPSLGVNQGEGSIFLSAVSLATTPWIAALTGCAVIAAILSTADSLINAIGSNVSQDFFTERNRSLNKTRWMSALIGAAAIFVSFYFNNIVDVLILSYDLSVSCLLIPLMAALFFKKEGNIVSAILAIVFGAVGFCIPYAFPVPILKEAIGVSLSLAGYLMGEGIALVQRRLEKSAA